MRLKFIATALMALLCAGVLAQERMTVRVVDHFDVPVPGWSVYITDPDGTDQGNFTTDANGEFTMGRTNANTLSLSVSYVFGLQEVWWDGSEDPVVVKLEDGALLTLHWPGQTDKQYAAAREFSYNGYITGLKWNDGEAKALIHFQSLTAPITWRITGGIFGLDYNTLPNVSEATNREIDIEIDWSSLGQIQLGLIYPNSGYAADFTLSDMETGEQLGMMYCNQPSTPEVDGLYYAVPGDYKVQMTSIREMNPAAPGLYYLPAPERTVQVQGGHTSELNYNYQEGTYHYTLKVLDVDGQPIPEATLSVNNYWYYTGTDGAFDESGEAVLVGYPGEYPYRVNKEYSINMADTIRLVDRDVEKTLSFADGFVGLTFELRSAAFITDHSRVDWNFDAITITEEGWEMPTSLYPQYDATTGLYKVTAPRLKDGVDDYYAYSINYPGSMPKRDTIRALDTENIVVDYNDYRAVKFVSTDADKYAVAYVDVLTSNMQYVCTTRQDEGNTAYVEEGIYTATVTMTDLVSGTVFPPTDPIPFTVGKEDVEVPCSVNLEDYGRLTVHLIGADGNGIPNEQVWLQSYDGSVNEGFTDENGQMVILLKKGTYSIDIFGGETPYPRYEETGIEINGDQEMTVSYEGYKLVMATLSGDVARAFAGGGYNSSLELQLREAHSEAFLWQNGGFPDVFLGSFRLTPQGNMLVSEHGLYVPEGTYYYKLDLSADGRQLKTDFGNRFELTEDKELQIDLSSPQYSKVTVNAVDENGQMMDGLVTVMQAEKYHTGESISSYTLPSVVFLSDGDYKAYYKNNTHMEDSYVVAQNFTVEGAPQEVTLKCVRNVDVYTLNVKVKLPAAMVDQMDEDFMRQELAFFKDGISVEFMYIDIDPTTGGGACTTRLPAGAYTYELRRAGQPKIDTFTLSADGQELVIDATADPYLLLRVTDETGNPLDDASVEISQDGKRIDYSYSGGTKSYGDICSFLPTGDFDVWVWEDGYQSVEKSIAMGTTTQTVDVVLPSVTLENFTVTFEIRDELYNYVYSPGTATLEAIGSCATGFAYTTFSGIPADTYPYTIEAEGYEPYKGLVVVNEASADWRSNTVHMVVFLRKKEQLTNGMEVAVMADGNTFRLFPTIATDVLHILPGTAAGGEWTVRITSSQGMAMYTARHVLDAETVLPVGNLAPGLYLLTLDNGTETVTYKFVKR